MVAEIGRVINSSLDVDEVYELLGEKIRKVIPFDRLTLSLVDNETQTTSRSWVLGTDVAGRRAGDEVPLAYEDVAVYTEEIVPLSSGLTRIGDPVDRFPASAPTIFRLNAS